MFVCVVSRTQDLERRMNRMARNLDHLERAKREEEAPLLTDLAEKKAVGGGYTQHTRVKLSQEPMEPVPVKSKDTSRHEWWLQYMKKRVSDIRACVCVCVCTGRGPRSVPGASAA